MTQRMLEPQQAVRGRPFTNPSLYRTDTRALTYMLHDLKCLVDANRIPVIPFASIEWDVNALSRRVMVCDVETLTGRHDELCFVGFFGERHLDRSMEPLERANAELVLEFRNYPGILSYSSMELYDGNWANLVIHDVPRAREYWRSSERHAEAAERLSPEFYRNVRIHNGTIPGGLSGGGDVVIHTTKYWDYTSKRVWRGFRDLTPGNAPDVHVDA